MGGSVFVMVDVNSRNEPVMHNTVSKVEPLKRHAKYINENSTIHKYIKDPSPVWEEFIQQIGPSSQQFSYWKFHEEKLIFNQETYDEAWEDGRTFLTI